MSKKKTAKRMSPERSEPRKLSQEGLNSAADMDELEHEIEQLEFYSKCYLRSAMQTLSYALPQLVNHVSGSSAKLGKAINLIEKLVFETELRIDALKSKRMSPERSEPRKRSIEGKKEAAR